MRPFTREEQRVLLVVGACALAASLLLLFPRDFRPRGSAPQPALADTIPRGPGVLPEVPSTPSTAHPVNPNYATYEELVQIPGLGPSLARAILLQREGSLFFRLEDLGAVRGLGPKTLEQLRPYITFDAPGGP